MNNLDDSDKESLVYLKCVTDGRKLRVRIISPGYNLEANCQFPRNIRQVGRLYSVPASDIRFSSGAQRKFFYRISKRNIQVVEENLDFNASASINAIYANLKIFTDEENNDCIICMDAPKEVVLAPCGHYQLCNGCANQLMQIQDHRCPMCRTVIDQIVERHQIQM